MEQLPLLRRDLKPDDLSVIYKRAFERELDAIIIKQATNPGRTAVHRATNLHYARYLTLLATEPRLLDCSLESYAELQSRGLSVADADALSILSQQHRGQQPVSHRNLSHDLMAVGIKPTSMNVQASLPTTAAAYRDACIAACEALGLPIQPEEVWPLPTHLEALVKKAPHTTAAISSETDDSVAPEQPAAQNLKSSSSLQHAIDQIVAAPVFASPDLPQRPDYTHTIAAEQLWSFGALTGTHPGIAAADARPIDRASAMIGQDRHFEILKTSNSDQPQPASALSFVQAQTPGTQQTAPDAAQDGPAPFANNASRTDIIGKDHRSAPLLSEFAKAAVTANINSGAWRKDRARDVHAAVAIFIAANGDIPVNRIEQQHLAEMAKLFVRLPKVYGYKRKKDDGSIAAETIEEALIRGDELRKIWVKDPVEAERQEVPYVGLSIVTQNKHLTWISALITYLKGEAAHLAPTGLDIRSVRKRLKLPSLQGERVMVSRGQKKNTARRPWTADDLKRLFDAPIWHGCAGLWHRFKHGDQVIHDGSYWVPLLLISNYGRVSEIAGLATYDVYLDCDVPYLKIRETGLRGLKTTSSARDVPIPSRLLDLGFADYVTAMRSAGHEALFPEFRHPTMTFQQTFSKIVFTPLRRFAFPDGTSRKRGRKDVDAHSIRTFGLDEVNKRFRETKDPSFDAQLSKALAGHEQEGTAAEHYLEDMRPRDLLPQVDFLTSFIPDIPRRPLNLRPPEHQKFGRPMGRPPIIR